jgi:hypothetical protein
MAKQKNYYYNMPIKKYKIKTNSDSNLEELLNILYNEACILLLSIQDNMSELKNSTDLSGASIDEKAKFAKAQHDFFMDKDKALRMKLDIAKIMNEILKFKGDESTALNNFNKKNGIESEVIDIKQLQQMMNQQETITKTESKNYTLKGSGT